MDAVLAFGPFRLHRQARQLRRGPVAVPLGGRAIDLLCALSAHPGEVLSHAELERAVWPGCLVDDSCLRVHVRALRRALDDEAGAARYIANVPGRGYSFVAPVLALPEDAAPMPAPQAVPRAPPLAWPVLGRDDDLRLLRAQRRRLHTIVGPGGVGKTALALALAHERHADYPDGVCFVDLGSCTDAGLVEGALAARLGLRSPRRMLLVLDNCEHLIEAATRSIEALLRAADGVDAIATSREPLCAGGEWVHRLAPLACPPDDPALGVEQALGYPALRLLVERAGLAPCPRQLPLAAALCRRMEGLPLALGFAAAHVRSLGLHGAVALFGDGDRLLDSGWRTALARQRSLRASFDWSVHLLTPTERQVLRACARFDGSFCFDEAIGAAAGAVDAAQAAQCVLALVDKSLIDAAPGGLDQRMRIGRLARTYLLSA